MNLASDFRAEVRVVEASHTLRFWWLEFGENPGFVSGIISTERVQAGILTVRPGLTESLQKARRKRGSLILSNLLCGCGLGL